MCTFVSSCVFHILSQLPEPLDSSIFFGSSFFLAPPVFSIASPCSILSIQHNQDKFKSTHSPFALHSPSKVPMLLVSHWPGHLLLISRAATPQFKLLSSRTDFVCGLRRMGWLRFNRFSCDGTRRR